MANPKECIVVTGAGGFIGHHLTTRLVQEGAYVRGVDIKYPDYEASQAQEFELRDLRRFDAALLAVRGAKAIYHLAADMGGIGFIETHKASIVYNNTMIDMNILEAARSMAVKQFLYTSSACVYPGYKQKKTSAIALKEEDAYPADAEDGYGWEKLYMERACEHYREDHQMSVRVVRFHNIFGPLGSYDGGREKSPAAICRKIALAKQTDRIEVWGDGLQTRSYCYIDDCVEGIYRLMQSGYQKPLNLGQDHLISINGLVALVAKIAGKDIACQHDLSKPQGVRGRNSDNSKLLEILGWQPQVSLEDGLRQTYAWISQQIAWQATLEKVDSPSSDNDLLNRQNKAIKTIPANVLHC